MNSRWQMPSPADVLDAIEHWRGLDLRSADEDEVREKMRAFRDKIKPFVAAVRKEQGLRLCRVRKIDAGSQLDSIDELWEVRSDQACLSRCNEQGRPALYCSLEASTCLDEVGVEVGDTILVTLYCSEKELRLARVVGPFDPNPSEGTPLLDARGLLSYRILREFIRSEFIKPVGKGTEYLYRISAAICQEWVSFDCDGWLYPAVKSPRGGNVALVPACAKAKLAVAEAIVAEVASTKEMPSMQDGTLIIFPGFDLLLHRRLQIKGGPLVWADPRLEGGSLVWAEARPGEFGGFLLM